MNLLEVAFLYHIQIEYFNMLLLLPPPYFPDHFGGKRRSRTSQSGIHDLEMRASHVTQNSTSPLSPFNGDPKRCAVRRFHWPQIARPAAKGPRRHHRCLPFGGFDFVVSLCGLGLRFMDQIVQVVSKELQKSGLSFVSGALQRYLASGPG